MIGVNNLPTRYRRQKTVAQAIAEGANVYTTIAAATAAGNEVLQGKNKAPAAMGDAATGLLPPEIPGGAMMEKEILVLPGQPVILPHTTA